jgi:glyoxylase-like metal-dependent hydrolase (beta-lactamase superfamily II)
MIINKTGEILSGLFMIGTTAMPVYLLDGKNPAVFDAGLAFLGGLYAKAIKGALGARPLQYCFLTHSHFDHCGSVSVLKSHFPSLCVLASQKAKSVMDRPNAIELMRQLTQAAFQEAARQDLDPFGVSQFEPFAVDRVLKEGDIIETSDGMQIEVLETPGHTWDTLSYYIPKKRILFCSEAAGMPDHTGYIVSDCLVDYDRYFESMLRLSRLDVEILCLGHSFVYTGKDVKMHFRQSIDECQAFLHLVESSLAKAGGDVQTAIKLVKKVEYDQKKGPKQLEAAYSLNLEARVKAIQKRMQNQDNSPLS